MNPTSILILHGGALGDFVLAVHFAAALRKHWNVRHVTMWARCGLLAWMEGRPPIDEAARLDTMGRLLFHDDEAMLLEQRQVLSRFDAIVSLLGRVEEPVVRPLARAFRGRILGIDPRAATEGSLTGRHITEQWLHQAGIDAPDISFTYARLDINEGARREWSERLRRRLRFEGSRPIALCHPGSGSLKKCLSLEQWNSLRPMLLERGFDAAWVIGPDERERMPRDWHQVLASAAPVLYEEDLPAASELVAGCDLYIGLDAGMTHVAALTGVKTLALFGSTDPAVWRPLGPRVHALLYSEGKPAGLKQDVSAAIEWGVP